jgi:hypothetical protein
LGITKKEGPAQPTPPSRAEKARPTHPESPAPATQTRKKPASTRTPVLQKSPARIIKTQPQSARKSPVGTTSAGQRSSLPLNQFRKHTPMKKNEMKRG